MTLVSLHKQEKLGNSIMILTLAAVIKNSVSILRTLCTVEANSPFVAKGNTHSSLLNLQLKSSGEVQGECTCIQQTVGEDMKG